MKMENDLILETKVVYLRKFKKYTFKKIGEEIGRSASWCNKKWHTYKKYFSNTYLLAQCENQEKKLNFLKKLLTNN